MRTVMRTACTGLWAFNAFTDAVLVCRNFDNDQYFKYSLFLAVSFTFLIRSIILQIEKSKEKSA